MELATPSSGSAQSLLLVSVALAAALFFMLSQRADEPASKRPASEHRNRPEAWRVDVRRRAGATVCGKRTGLLLVLVARASQLAEAHPENKLKAETGNTSSVDERFAELYSTIAELARENKRLGLAATLAQSQCAEQLALEKAKRALKEDELAHVKAQCLDEKSELKSEGRSTRSVPVMRANETEPKLTKRPEKHISSESAKSTARDASVDDAPAPAVYDDEFGEALRLEKAKSAMLEENITALASELKLVNAAPQLAAEQLELEAKLALKKKELAQR